MDGILLINKPRGPSSFFIVKKVRALSGVKKVGHAGTLDPLASGLLVLCLGKYTKLASLITNGDKVYETTIQLGATTKTDDDESEIITRSYIDHLTKQHIVDALKAFTGKIQQIPPKYSAIKLQGRRAYDMARADKEFHLLPREIEIYDITLIDFSKPMVCLRIHCSKGTYIRSIARDLGQALGVGAFAKTITRLASSGFIVDDAATFDGLTKQQIETSLITGKNALGNISTIEIDKIDKERVSQGGKMLGEINTLNEDAVMVCEDDLVAIVKKDNSFGAKLARVL